MRTTWALVAGALLSCGAAPGNVDTAAAKNPEPASVQLRAVPDSSAPANVSTVTASVFASSDASTAIANPSPSARSSPPSAPVAARPPSASTTGEGLAAFRACLSIWGSLELAPRAVRQAASVGALAAGLGFRARSRASALAAFCDPELRENFCAYADCSLPDAAFTWHMTRPDGIEMLSGILVLKGPNGSASAYAAAATLELSERQYACGCMGGSEFARIEQISADVVVVNTLAQTRPRQMCHEAHTKSTWMLDEQRRPVAVIRSNGELEVSTVAVTRAGDRVSLHVAGHCEAHLSWSELVEAAASRPED